MEMIEFMYSNAVHAGYTVYIGDRVYTVYGVYAVYAVYAITMQWVAIFRKLPHSKLFPPNCRQ